MRTGKLKLRLRLKLKLKLVVLLLTMLSVPALGSIINVKNTGLWAAGKISTGSKVTITGSIASGSGISTGYNASITGNLYSSGKLSIGNNSSITGNVTPDTGTSLFTGSKVKISGSTDKADLNFDSFSVPWQNQMKAISIGTDNVYGGKNSTTNLLAGKYRDLSFNKSTTLNLTAGNYSFKNFWMDRSGVVNLNTSSGDITLNMLGSFSTGRGVRFKTTGTGQVYINVYKHNASLGTSSQIKAALNVYGGNISVGNRVKLTGTFYTTGNIWLGNKSSVEYSAQSVPEPATIFLLAAMGLLIPRRKHGLNVK